MVDRVLKTENYQNKCFDKSYGFLSSMQKTYRKSLKCSLGWLRGRQRHTITKIALLKKVIVFSLGYAKTYQKALKVALGRPIRHQISKITKIFILIKVMVFTWACKNITEGPKGTLGLPLGRQRCKVPIYPFQQKTWFLQWYGKTYLESQKCLWLANKASKMQNHQNTHVNKSYGFCMGMQKYIKSP